MHTWLFGKRRPSRPILGLETLEERCVLFAGGLLSSPLLAPLTTALFSAPGPVSTLVESAALPNNPAPLVSLGVDVRLPLLDLSLQADLGPGLAVGVQSGVDLGPGLVPIDLAVAVSTGPATDSQPPLTPITVDVRLDGPESLEAPKLPAVALPVPALPALPVAGAMTAPLNSLLSAPPTLPVHLARAGGDAHAEPVDVALPLSQLAPPATPPAPKAAEQLPQGFVNWADLADPTADAQPPFVPSPTPPRGDDLLFSEAVALPRAGHHLPEPLTRSVWAALGQVASEQVSAPRTVVVADEEPATDGPVPQPVGPAEAGAIDPRALELAFTEFLGTLTDLEKALTGWLAHLGPYPWVIMALALAGTAYGTLWCRRERRDRLVAEDDGEWRMDWATE